MVEPWGEPPGEEGDRVGVPGPHRVRALRHCVRRAGRRSARTKSKQPATRQTAASPSTCSPIPTMWAHLPADSISPPLCTHPVSVRVTVLQGLKMTDARPGADGGDRRHRRPRPPRRCNTRRPWLQRLIAVDISDEESLRLATESGRRPGVQRRDERRCGEIASQGTAFEGVPGDGGVGEVVPCRAWSWRCAGRWPSSARRAGFELPIFDVVLTGQDQTAAAPSSAPATTSPRRWTYRRPRPRWRPTTPMETLRGRQLRSSSANGEAGSKGRSVNRRSDDTARAFPSPPAAGAARTVAADKRVSAAFPPLARAGPAALVAASDTPGGAASSAPRRPFVTAETSSTLGVAQSRDVDRGA